MAHELTIKNGKAEMAYVGKKPWHGLGQELDQNADIDQWKIAAGMNWQIQAAPVQFKAGKATHTLNTHRVLFRDDTQDVVGVVGDRFQIVQPGELVEFFRDLTTSAGFKMETAGTLYGGKKFWALASIGASANIVGRKDKVGGYLLLSTATDGSMSTTGRFTTVRVVCQNTLNMAFADAKPEVSVRHSTKFNADSVKAQLGVAQDAFETFTAQAKSLANVELSVDEARDFVNTLLVETKTVQRADNNASESKQFSNIIDLFTGKAMGADLAGQTAWGLVNAVTEYVDHHAKASTASNRIDSAWFGRGDILKNAAFDKALKLAA